MHVYKILAHFGTTPFTHTVRAVIHSIFSGESRWLIAGQGSLIIQHYFVQCFSFFFHFQQTILWIIALNSLLSFANALSSCKTRHDSDYWFVFTLRSERVYFTSLAFHPSILHYTPAGLRSLYSLFCCHSEALKSLFVSSGLITKTAWIDTWESWKLFFILF